MKRRGALKLILTLGYQTIHWFKGLCGQVLNYHICGSLMNTIHMCDPPKVY